MVSKTREGGAELIKRKRSSGFTGQNDEAKTEGKAYESMKEKVLAEVKKTFRPEFLNRLDEVIVFHELTGEQLRKIVDLMVKDLEKRLAERKLGLEMTDAAKSWLAKAGFDPVYGARPLRRAVERYVENPLSTKVLRGEFKDGDTVIVDLVEEEWTFTARVASETTG